MANDKYDPNEIISKENLSEDKLNRINLALSEISLQKKERSKYSLITRLHPFNSANGYHENLDNRTAEQVKKLIAAIDRPDFVNPDSEISICRFSRFVDTSSGKYFVICIEGPVVKKGGKGGRFGGPPPIIKSASLAIHISRDKIYPIGKWKLGEREDICPDKPWATIVDVIEQADGYGVLIEVTPLKPYIDLNSEIYYYDFSIDRYILKWRSNWKRQH